MQESGILVSGTMKPGSASQSLTLDSDALKASSSSCLLLSEVWSGFASYSSATMLRMSSLMAIFAVSRVIELFSKNVSSSAVSVEHKKFEAKD